MYTKGHQETDSTMNHEMLDEMELKKCLILKTVE